MSADQPGEGRPGPAHPTSAPPAPDRARSRLTLGALAAIVVGVVAALTIASGGDDDDVTPPSTTVPPSTTTTVGPWQAADFAGLPQVHSEVVPVGGQLFAYHTVEPDGSVVVVVVDAAESRVNWRRTVELPDRIAGVPLPPPAFQESQNLIHVFVDESQRAPEAPLPGADEPSATPTPTRDPDVEPQLAVVGIDASDGFGITDVRFDVRPLELPSMCGERVCFGAFAEAGSSVVAFVDPSAGTFEIADVGFARVVVSDGPDAITIGDGSEDDFRGEVVATTDHGAALAWTSTIDDLFDGADVSPNRGWGGMRTAAGDWVVWLPARAADDPPVGDVFAPLQPGEVLPPGAVSVIGAGGTPRATIRGSLCRSLRTGTDVPVTAFAVCDGAFVADPDGRLSSPSDEIRLVDARDGAIVDVIATPGYDDFSADTRVSLIDDGVFELDTGDSSVVVDLVAGTVEPLTPDTLGVRWCSGAGDGSNGVPILDDDGLRTVHRVVDPVYPCTAALGEVPAGAVGEMLRTGELDPGDVGFVRSAEWVTWVGPDRLLRAVRLG